MVPGPESYNWDKEIVEELTIIEILKLYFKSI